MSDFDFGKFDDKNFDNNDSQSNAQNNIEANDSVTGKENGSTDYVMDSNIRSSGDGGTFFVNVPKDNLPIVVLCGPPNSGKSMIIKCLANYLYNDGSLGYSIKANETLIGGTGEFAERYKVDCKNFNDKLSISEPASNTTNFLLADVVDRRGNVRLHLLEAPGEDFFLPDRPNAKFPLYLNVLGSNKARKTIYIILLDLDSTISYRTQTHIRNNYQNKMINLYNLFVQGNSRSTVILLYNKADIPQEGRWANTNGVLNFKAIEKDAKDNYNQLFNSFKKKVLGFFEIDNFVFLPFCTGTFGKIPGVDEMLYTPSGDYYPKKLWQELTKVF